MGACSSGVPHGSGPILFSILMNSCYNTHHSHSTAILFADDLSIEYNTLDYSQEELDNLINWSNENKLILNPSKCHVINFSLHPLSLPHIFIGNQPLSELNQFKLLGVTLCSNMDLKPHGESVIAICHTFMSLLRKLRHSGFNNSTLWKVYLALIFSRLSYSWPAICDMPQSILRRYLIFEKQASSLCGHEFHEKNLTGRLDRICINLMKKVSADPNHPVRQVFVERQSNPYQMRRHCAVLPFNKSTSLEVLSKIL